MSFDIETRRETFLGVHLFEHEWAIKLFMVTAEGVPFADLDSAKRALAEMLQAITNRMSPEFEYGRFGCAIVHTGRRGTCVTVTHFGNWGRTFEIFSSGWYRYGHGFDNFDLLDDVEPALCWFEVPRTFKEIRLACDLARSFDLHGVRARYLSAPPSTPLEVF